MPNPYVAHVVVCDLYFAIFLRKHRIEKKTLVLLLLLTKMIKNLLVMTSFKQDLITVLAEMLRVWPFADDEPSFVVVKVAFSAD